MMKGIYKFLTYTQVFSFVHIAVCIIKIYMHLVTIVYGLIGVNSCNKYQNMFSFAHLTALRQILQLHINEIGPFLLKSQAFSMCLFGKTCQKCTFLWIWNSPKDNLIAVYNRLHLLLRFLLALLFLISAVNRFIMYHLTKT